MSMSISGAMLSGVSSSLLNNGSKRNGGLGGGSMSVGRKNATITPQRKNLWVLAAVKDDGKSKNDPKWLDDAS